MRPLFIPGLLGCVVCQLVFAGGAAAATKLDEEMSIVAEQVAQFLKAEEQDSISIGEFTAPPQLQTSSGLAISQSLKSQFEKREIKVQRAKYGIEGKFRDVEDAQSKRIAAEITGQVTDRSGKVVLSFKRGVFGDGSLGTLFGVTVKQDPQADKAVRDDKLRDALDNPKTNIKDGVVSASDKFEFGLQIMVKKDGEFVPVETKDAGGEAVVSLAANDEYAIKIINNSPTEAAVALTLDGLSMFALSENKDYTQVVIDAKGDGLITGWHINNERSDAFVVVPFGKSVVAQQGLPNSAKVGTITASFSAAFPADAPPPDELPPGKADADARSGNATGRGAQLKKEYTEVKRSFGVIRETITIRYSK